MKALLCRTFGPVENLEFAEVAAPAMAPGHVRVAVEVAGLNFPDGLVVQGKYQLRPELPFAPGSEFAGVVAQTAPGVEGFAVGDRVFGLTSFGAFAEQVVVPTHRLHHMSPEIRFAEASILSMAYGAAMYALFDRGGLAAGDDIVVLGATGGVGMAAVELAALAGARVLAVDGDDIRLSALMGRGATAVYNYNAGSLRDAVRAFAPSGAAVILDPVGGSLGEEAVRCLGWNGRLLVFGFASGNIPSIATNLLLLKGASAIGVFWGESQRRGDNNDQANFERIIDWHREGKVRPFIGRTYPLAQGAEAIAALMRGEIAGKAVLIIGSANTA